MTLVLVVTLEVRTVGADAFHDFERQAASIMEMHGGRIERAITVPGDAGSQTFREVHLITFPSEEDFAAYRADPKLTALAGLRNDVIVSTGILAGHDGPDYHQQGGDPG